MCLARTPSSFCALMNQRISRGTQRVSSRSSAFSTLRKQPRLVLGVEDLEALRQPGLAPMQAQQPVREAVEGADPQRAAGIPEQGLDAPAHFRGGLVGEGDGEDAVRRGALHLDQPGDAVHQHARLAAARAREHQRRAERRGHGLPLRVVQTVE